MKTAVPDKALDPQNFYEGEDRENEYDFNMWLIWKRNRTSKTFRKELKGKSQLRKFRNQTEWLIVIVLTKHAIL